MSCLRDATAAISIFTPTLNPNNGDGKGVGAVAHKGDKFNNTVRGLEGAKTPNVDDVSCSGSDVIDLCDAISRDTFREKC